MLSHAGLYRHIRPKVSPGPLGPRLDLAAAGPYNLTPDDATRDPSPLRRMTRSRRSDFWRSLGRRLCAGVALVAYLGTAIGLPLPSFARKDHSIPFPCQDNPCGCRTAEQCWRHCCCLSVEERWAWAQEHNITPPDYAERPPEGWDEKPQRGKDCCESADQPACSCCRHAAAPQPKPAPGPQWQLGVASLRCRGLSTLWVSVAAALPPAPPLAWEPCLPPGDWLQISDPTAALIPSPPLEPPPRL